MTAKLMRLSSQYEAIAWLEAHQLSDASSIEMSAPSKLRRWHRDPDSGDLVHESGHFFRIVGMKVSEAGGGRTLRPVLLQPDGGLLALLIRRAPDGWDILVQAKMEPGNEPRVQMAPTVQATSSNLAKAHGGNSVPLAALVHELAQSPDYVVFDAMLGEQPEYFFRKANRHLIVVAPPHPDAYDLSSLSSERFAWCPHYALVALAGRDSTLNADLRSLISVLGPFGRREAIPHENGRDEQPSPERLDMQAVTSHDRVEPTRVPLSSVPGWRDWSEIDNSESEPWGIQGVRIRTEVREAKGWDQPLIQPQALHARRIRYSTTLNHVALARRVDPLSVHGWEWVPEFDSEPLAPDQGVSRECVVTHEEEGGRFIRSATRHEVLHVADEVAHRIGSELTWAHPVWAARHPNSSMELRSSIATLYSTMDLHRG